MSEKRSFNAFDIENNFAILNSSTDGYIVVFRNQSGVIDSGYSLLSVGKASDDNFIIVNKAPIPKVQDIQILSIEQCKRLIKQGHL